MFCAAIASCLKCAMLALNSLMLNCLMLKCFMLKHLILKCFMLIMLRDRRIQVGGNVKEVARHETNRHIS